MKQVSIHLQKFVDRVRGLEARGAKECIMSLQEAKDLHADITRLLINLETLREEKTNTQSKDEAIVLEVSGGDF